jgi:environmental stress-induced protein Ves
MVQPTLIRLADCMVQPWKNGKGETREIAVDASQPYLWRLSRAVLEGSGPFSPYPGYQRILVLLGGSDAKLHHEGRKSRLLPPMVAAPFSGDWETRIETQGKAEDFNVFTLSGKAKGGCYPAYLRMGEEVQLPIAGQEHFVHCVEGGLELLESNTGGKFRLEPGDTFRLTRQGEKEFLNLRMQGLTPKACALWIVIHTGSI